MLLKIYKDNISKRQMSIIIDVLINDGVMIYPTDTVYAYGCSLYSRKGMERIAQLKGHKANRAKYSLVCKDLSQASEYTAQIGNQLFRAMKRNLPGPFTFILPANGQVPRIFRSQKKTVGIRVPDHALVTKVVEELGHPLVSSSVHAEDEIIEHLADPELIYDRYKKQVDLVIDGGHGGLVGSTIINCTSGELEIVRAGLGEFEE